jgi:hypothetical protein
MNTKAPGVKKLLIGGIIPATCHHGMTRPQVADGGDGLQVWRVAVNILNNQWRRADEGRSSSLRVGLIAPHRKK